MSIIGMTSTEIALAACIFFLIGERFAIDELQIPCSDYHNFTDATIGVTPADDPFVILSIGMRSPIDDSQTPPADNITLADGPLSVSIGLTLPIGETKITKL